MPPFKKENIKASKDFLESKKTINNIWQIFWNEYIDKGLSSDDKAKVIKEFQPPLLPPLKETLTNIYKKQKVKLPKAISDMKVYSGTEMTQRRELSKKANEAIAKTAYDEKFITCTLNTLKKQNKISEAQFKYLTSSRGSHCFFFNAPLKLNEDEILEKALYLTGNDLNKELIGEKKYNDILLERKVSAYNETLNTLAAFDFSNYDNLSDKDIVRKWEEYRNFSYTISEFENEIKGDIKKYLNQSLVKRIDEQSKARGQAEMQMMHRICLIADGNYTKADTDFLFHMTEIDRQNLSNVLEGAEKNIEHLNLTIRFIDTAGPYYEYLGNTCAQYVQYYFNKKNEIKNLDDIVFFDKKGNTIDYAGLQYYTGEFFAAPKDRPQQLTAFEVDYANNGTKMPDLTPFAKIMNKIKQGFTNDLDKQDAAMVEKLLDKVPLIKENATDLVSLSATIYSAMIGDKETDAEAKKQKIEATLQSLKKTYAPKRPQVSKAEYEKLFKIKPSERLSMAEVEERRLLSEKVVDAIINTNIQRIECHTIPDKIFNKIIDPSRHFRAFIFKHEQGKVNENNKAFRDFFGLDDNFNRDPKIKDEVINKNRIRIVQNQLDYYKQIRDDLKNIKWTDAALIENYSKVFSYCLAIDMEMKSFFSQFKDIKLEENYQKLSEELFKDAAYFNGFILPKADSIANPYYQFGSTNKLFLPEFESLSESFPDKMLTGAFLRKMSGLPNTKEIYDKQLETLIGEMQNVEYAYTKSGDPVGLGQKDELAVTRMLEAGEELFFFKKDSMQPTVVTLSKTDATQLDNLPLTKEREEQARIMRTNAALDKIRAEAKDAPNPSRYLNKMSAYVMKQFEVAQIYAEMEDLTGLARTEKYYELREKLTEYLSLAAVKSMLFKMKATGKFQEEFFAEVLKQENLQKYAKQLGETKAVDMLMEDMMKDPNPKMLFEKLDEEKLVKQLSLKQKEVAEINKAIAAEDKALFKERVTNAITYSVKAYQTKDPEYWGLTKNELKKSNTTIFSGLSISRSSIQTITLGYLVKQGYSFEQIFSDDKEMQQKRAEAGREIITIINYPKELATENGKLEQLENEIGESLLAGAKALNEYVNTNLNNVKDISAREFLKPENSILANLYLCSKDFSQEMQKLREIANQFNTDEYIKVEKNTSVYAEMLNTFASATMHTANAIVTPSDKSGDSLEYVAENSLDKIISEAAHQAAFKYYKNLPENNGKSLTESFQMEYRKIHFAITAKLYEDNDFINFKDKVSKDPELSRKVLVGVLDGSLINDLQFDVKYVKNIDTTEPEIKFTSTVNNMINNVKARNLGQYKNLDKIIQLKSSKEEKQQEIKHTKAIDPNKKLKNITNQINKLEKNEELKRSNSQPNIKAKGMSM